MPIEQRQGIRRKKLIEVDLCLDGGALPSRVRDIGMAAPAWKWTVPRSSRWLRSRCGGVCTNRARHASSLPAEMVHVGCDGVALKFRQHDHWAYTALVNFLYAAH